MSNLKKHFIKFIDQIGKIRIKKQNNKITTTSETTTTTTKKSILSQAVLIFGTAFLTFVLSIALQAILASEWLNPTAVPPASNVEPPINEGDETQVKLGSLGIANDFYAGLSLFAERATKRVAIGTSSPQHLLHLYKTDGNNAELDIQSNPGMNNHWAIYNDRATNQLRFWKGNDRLTITKDGNVGIGTMRPDVVLDVQGNRDTGRPAYILSTELSSNTKWGGGVMGRKNRNGGNIQAGDELGKYLAKGYYSGSYKFGAGISMQVDGNPIPGAKTIPTSISFGTSDGTELVDETVQRMVIKSNGNVGIGTPTPGAKLEVNGRIKAKSPVDPNDVATKAYVDAASGLSWAGYTKAYNGNLGHVKGANEKCNSAYAGSHWCSLEELARLGTLYPFTYDIWVSASNITAYGVYGYGNGNNDRCCYIQTNFGESGRCFSSGSNDSDSYCKSIMARRTSCRNWNISSSYSGFVLNKNGYVSSGGCSSYYRLGCCY